MKQATTLIDGLYFGEAPRWHDGRLWYSDFYDKTVKSVDLKGNTKLEVQLDEQPSGLGWLPDGRLLVVGMQSLTLKRLEKSGLVMHADLSEYSTHLCNDMVVDKQGNAYVGNFGFNLDQEMQLRGVEGVLANHPKANIVKVTAKGEVSVATGDMSFPNGSVITPDGKTLIVAETLGLCLTAFDITEKSELVNRRVWANTGARVPDGICMNADGNIWIANAVSNECVLLAQGGEVLEIVSTSQNCYACMLGSEDDKTLFMLTAQSSHAALAGASRAGKIEMAKV
ncbi:MAG: sugar lactone lactonase YvrE [Glaciecola sp.]|jgi:sugar lactone lactonase YvrE